MDCKQFCDMLKAARKTSGITWPQVENRMGRSHASVSQLFSVKIDSSMNTVFNYLHAVKMDILMELKRENHTNYLLHTSEDLNKWVHNSYSHKTTVALAKQFNSSQSNMSKIMNGRDVKVSMFLEMAEDQGAKIQLVSSEPVSQHGLINDCDFDML